MPTTPRAARTNMSSAPGGVAVSDHVDLTREVVTDLVACRSPDRPASIPADGSPVIDSAPSADHGISMRAYNMGPQARIPASSYFPHSTTRRPAGGATVIPPRLPHPGRPPAESCSAPLPSP